MCATTRWVCALGDHVNAKEEISNPKLQGKSKNQHPEAQRAKGGSVWDVEIKCLAFVWELGFELGVCSNCCISPVEAVRPQLRECDCKVSRGAGEDACHHITGRGSESRAIDQCNLTLIWPIFG